ncbi:hypothetical protein PFISCL1PPCAC_24473, partial [Pristionchus fissidentatus]
QDASFSCSSRDSPCYLCTPMLRWRGAKSPMECKSTQAGCYTIVGQVQTKDYFQPETPPRTFKGCDYCTEDCKEGL